LVFLWARQRTSGSEQLKQQTLQAGSLQLEQAKVRLDNLSHELQLERDKVLALTAQLAAARAQEGNLQQRLLEQRTEVDAIQQKLNLEFQQLANNIMEEKSKRFAEQNQNSLNDILRPFQEKIRDFEKKVDETYDKEMRDKISLREEVKRLYELNARISEEANNLTRALKGDTKKQGNWGEFILEKVLERSGLIKDQAYKTQVVTRNVEGEIIKPDVVVFLPNQKHLVIDAKVSLTAYEQLVNAENEEQRERFLREHLNSVRNHVKLLSDKNYYTSADFASPDFVLLFMPMEAAFSAAVQQDPDLFSYAWDRKIVIVSPTTLLATLRTVESLWRMENQNRYALEIAEEAGKLYDKFEGLTRDLIEIGVKMDASKGAYEQAMKKISTGPGNLIKKVEQLKTLGARATKSLPPSLIERANEE